MNKVETKASVAASSCNVQSGSVHSASSTNAVGRFVPKNKFTLDILFFVLAFIQACQNGWPASVMQGLNILPSYTEYFVLDTTNTALNTASF